MDFDDVFTRATLYESCKNDRVLADIGIEKFDLPTLRVLLNKKNSRLMCAIPVLMSKMLTKFVMTFIVDKFPTIGRYVDPETIAMQLEDDEAEYLQSMEIKFQPKMSLWVKISYVTFSVNRWNNFERVSTRLASGDIIILRNRRHSPKSSTE
jgi:hypothetical protein